LFAMRRFVLTVAKAVLPDRVVDWYRRRRALRRYLKALSFEIYHRQVRLDREDLEGRVAARRDGFYEQLVKDVLERTELILQELDRRIEGVSARQGNALREIRRDVEALRGLVETRAPRVDPLPSTAEAGPSEPGPPRHQLEPSPVPDR
jgi:hypothetical protein